MKLAPPPRGSVIRYAYLWASEHRRGQDEARKDRPSLVVAASVRQTNGQTEIMVLAVTHTAPLDNRDAVMLPADAKKTLGLDTQTSWIVTTEANAFVWPGPEIRPIPNRKPATYLYGQIPEKLLRKVAQSYLANRARQRTDMISRK